MKCNLLKTFLILMAISSVSPATESASYEPQSPFDCLPHTDNEYKKLISGQWRFSSTVDYLNTKLYTDLEFGTTGMVKLTMIDIDNPLIIYNEAYGYYDVKNSSIITTFYHETRSEVGLADNEPYVLTLNCACLDKMVITFNNNEFVLNRI